MYVTVDPVTAALWEWNGERLEKEKDAGWSYDAIETVVERVNKGAQLLDREKPGWRREVLPDQLRMNNVQFCVIGQVYGDYDQYVGVPFGLGENATEEACGESIEHGFLVDEEDTYPYALLDMVWVAMLAERAETGNDSILLELPPRMPRNKLIQILKDEKQISV